MQRHVFGLTRELGTHVVDEHHAEGPAPHHSRQAAEEVQHCELEGHVSHPGRLQEAVVGLRLQVSCVAAVPDALVSHLGEGEGEMRVRGQGGVRERG